MALGLSRWMLILGLAGAATSSQAQEPFTEADGETDRIELESLLRDIPDASREMSEDVDRWVLHDVLQGNFAATGEMPLAVGMPSDASQEPPSLVDEMESARLEALLRGEPVQHHAVDMMALNFDIPVMSHPLVDLYIDYFTGRGRLFFAKWLNRAERYVPIMQRILAEHHVPKDLVYLAMIESGFSSHAYSTAAAAGFWQFIGSTGALYGLKQDLWQDDRQDFVLATHAAASYLAQLHRSFGDWHLAWASYNAGETRVRRALARYQATTFWELCDLPQSLAKETLHYVPKIIAAAIVAKDAARYGFTLKPESPLLYEEVQVQGALDLHVLAQETGIMLSALRDLNPSLLHDMTPPGKNTFLRVPKSLREPVVLALKRLPPSKRTLHFAHRVVRGDTLIGLAKRYRCDVLSIRSFNRLKSDKLRLGQQVIVPTFANRLTKGRLPVTVAAMQKSPPKRLARARQTKSRVRQHVVVRGETLWSIAKRYHTSVERIRGHRTRSARRLVVGEVVEIF